MKAQGDQDSCSYRASLRSSAEPATDIGRPRYCRVPHASIPPRRHSRGSQRPKSRPSGRRFSTANAGHPSSLLPKVKVDSRFRGNDGGGGFRVLESRVSWRHRDASHEVLQVVDDCLLSYTDAHPPSTSFPRLSTAEGPVKRESMLLLHQSPMDSRFRGNDNTESTSASSCSHHSPRPGLFPAPLDAPD